MTDERKELIERWAREAFGDVFARNCIDPDALERFAALVRADDDRILRESVPERWKDCASAIGAVQSYIAELEGAVSRARADALEEAADVCEAPLAFSEDDPGASAADAIRKLIQAP